MAGEEAVVMDRESCLEVVNSIIRNKKNSNGIIDLEKLLLSEEKNVVLSAIEANTKLFCHFMENGNFNSSITGMVVDNGEADEKYHSWLKERYSEIKSLLFDHLQHSSKYIQVSALTALMRFVKAEGENPMKAVPGGTWYFPKKTFQHIIERLSSYDKNMHHVITSFSDYTKYSDVKLYIFKSVAILLENYEKELSSFFLRNIFHLLSEAHFPHDICNEDATDVQTKTFIDNSGPVFKLKSTVFRKVFSSVWIKFLSFKLPSSLYKSVLTSLDKEVLPHLKNPLLLTDFFTDSYNVGGLVSLLALRGLFFLMQKYNLEYPNFYQKLYALFQPDIITSKHRALFFSLADLFLSSTHLPSYLVAAFIKRLGRLALAAPPHVLLVIIPFIRNLLIRHPSLKVLIHSPEKIDVASDPYDADVSDPAKSNAIDSSLWEIKSLQNHWYPDVSRKAKFLNHPLPQIECSLSDVLDLSIGDLVQMESETKIESAPMSFHKPLGLFEREGDKMCDLWTL